MHPGVLTTLLHFDSLTAIMLALVATLGAVIFRFSRRYLDGQPNRAGYDRWLLATLTATVILVASNHLLLLAVAWTASSLCVHQLLLFFPNRREAQSAARKKFLLARLGDCLVFTGLWCIGYSVGTFSITDLRSAAAALTAVTPLLHAGGLLLAGGVIVRSAQLPFHGWLIQVMEAPTPVSALLHAGVVNIGGFVLIRLAPLMVQLEPAQTLLVLFGATTAALASLIMMTRISVKVSLAWSTCAQMGFMLLECGLGAYSLALMHLVAHSLYKAHAFLGSGSRVRDHVQLGARPRPLRSDATPPRTRTFASIAAVVLMFVAWHNLFPNAVPAHSTFNTGIGWVIAGCIFAGFCVVQLLVLVRPGSALAQRLYPHFLAGLYLDELFTRLTFWAWSPAPVQSVNAGIAPTEFQRFAADASS